MGALARWRVGESMFVPADDGCDLFPSCLGCVLPACRYDLPPKRAGALLREAELRRLLAQGKTIDQAAVILGVSRRSIFRLKRYAALAMIVPLFSVGAPREEASDA